MQTSFAHPDQPNKRTGTDQTEVTVDEHFTIKPANYSRFSLTNGDKRVLFQVFLEEDQLSIQGNVEISFPNLLESLNEQVATFGFRTVAIFVCLDNRDERYERTISEIQHFSSNEIEFHRVPGGTVRIVTM